jgi:hypothetical protein
MRQSTPRSLWPLAAAALTTGWLISVPASIAQAQSTSPAPSPAPSQQTPAISDQKLDAAANAIKEVAAVKDKYQQRLQAASPSDKDGIVNEANAALTKAITDQGLSIEEYNSILVVAQNDPTVREKILQRIRQGDKPR